MTKVLERILIADDNVAYRNAITRALFHNYLTDFASTANEEIAKARQHQYSLIVTDNQMEDGYGNSGIYAIEQIRKFDKHTPIILYTAIAASDIKVEALNKGANEVLIKGSSLSKLKEAIRKYLHE